MQTSVFYPLQPSDPGSMVRFGEFAQEHGARRLWMGQSLRLESHLVLAALAARVPGLALGTGVALTPLRHPFTAAVDARTLAALSGAPYVAGFGPGQPSFQGSVLPAPYDRPLRAVREYATVMRGLLDGKVVDHDGEFYSVHGGLEPIRSPEVEIGLGVLRSGMARTAGRVADVAITWLTPHWYLSGDIMPTLADGAADSGRKPPRVVSVVHVAVDRPKRNLRRAGRVAAGAHLGSDHYTDMLRRAGIAADPAAPVKGVEALIEANIFATGTPEEIAAEVRKYYDAGVDEVVLNACGVFATEGETAALRDLHEILAALGAREEVG
ncbi:LLM class flavin-dependent oxidoreductase [Amycolatopsis sp. NBC_00345]|uniref:LLM class flavin-dependent oxidoreductase n=1 Tax=Amycolatopsis sp. NBC_00345 TaxID=2975955 RepID=UPI002E26FFB5